MDKPLSPDMSAAPVELSARFAVINAAQVPARYWNDLPFQRIVPEAYREHAEVFPILVDLHELDDRQHASIKAREAEFCLTSGKSFRMALLDAPGTSGALIRHLCRRMVVRLPDGGEDVLRIHDPLVFRHLRWLLSVEQMDSLLGHVETWHWREPDGVWRSHARRSPEPCIRPLRLTPEQWPTLLRMAELQFAIGTLVEDAHPHAYCIETARQLDQSLADAESIHGMSAPEDRRLFAIQALRFGRSIHQHHALRERIAAVRSGEMSFISACSGLNDMHLQRFAKELQEVEPSQR